MFSLKFLNCQYNTTRLSATSLANGSSRLMGFFSKDKKPEENEELMIVDDEILDPEIERQRIDKLRNKSRLLPQHQRFVHGEVPYDTAESWIHTTLKYQRKIYGKYGSKSNLDPRICFFTQTELEEKRQWEQKANPFTIKELLETVQTEKMMAQEKVQKREQDIAKNLSKLDHWMKEIDNRKAKKEEEARVAKERKDRLIEEVRRHFGFALDPRDDRFKEMLAAKEKEQKKAMKEKKRQEKEAKLIAKLVDANDSKEEKKSETSVNETT